MPDSFGAVIENCGVRFNWVYPIDGNDIFGYTLAVRGNSGDYYAVPNCGEQPEDNSCMVSMQVLKENPWFLK